MAFSLAIISDIHGNAVALDSVLDDIQLENVEQILCLGDVVAFGPEPERSLELVRASKCDVIMGNTDEWVIKPPSIKTSKGKARMRAKQLRWCHDALTKKDLDYLRSFKLTEILDLGFDRELLGFHGSPKSSNDIILSTTSVGELEEMVSGFSSQIYVGGHTHLSMLRRLRSSIFLNPGSVGLPVDRFIQEESEQQLLPYAEYLIIHSSEETLSIEFRQVDLDIEAIIESVEASEFPHKERWSDGWKQLLD